MAGSITNLSYASKTGVYMYVYSSTVGSSTKYEIYSTLAAGTNITNDPGPPANTATFTYYSLAKFDANIPDGSSIAQLTINLTSDKAIRFSLAAYNNDNPPSAAQALYNSLSACTSFGTYSGSTSYIITITDMSVIAAIIEYGLVFQGWSDGIVYFSACTISGDYADYDQAPVCTPVSPVSTTILADSSIVLTWSYSQDAGITQSHYDLQYSQDGGASWTSLASKVSGTITSYTVPANTFNAGVVTWRVRAYITNGTVCGEWAEASVIVRVNPGTSSVTCDTNPRPTVSWTAADQKAYRVKFGEYDSGAIFGDAATYTIPRIFTDGVYAVSVCTQTSTGAWSEWSEDIYIAISNAAATGSVSLRAYAENVSVKLEWSCTNENVSHYAVYRGDICIAFTTGLTYTDIYTASEYSYHVIGYISDSSVIYSPTVYGAPNISCDVISAVTDISWISLRYSMNESMTRSYDISVDMYYKYYAGYRYPVAVTSGKYTGKGSFTKAFKTRNAAERILALAGKTVIYKDKNGGLMYGTLSTAGYDSERRFSVSFEIYSTNHDEEVDINV